MGYRARGGQETRRRRTRRPSRVTSSKAATNNKEFPERCDELVAVLSAIAAAHNEVCGNNPHRTVELERRNWYVEIRATLPPRKVCLDLGSRTQNVVTVWSEELRHNHTLKLPVASDSCGNVSLYHESRALNPLQASKLILNPLLQEL